MTGTDVAGTIPEEVALLTELGPWPAAALAAASTSARRYLRFSDLVDGRPADLVTYHNDPATTLTCSPSQPPSFSPATASNEPDL